jgi:hypothetical protein
MILLQDDPISSARYLPWGWFSISVPNAIVIAVMLTLLVLAIVLPLPKERRSSRRGS